MKSPAFQIYPAEFLADGNTLVMNTTEIGAYCLLLFVCWRENGLPDDAEELAVIARLPFRQFQPIWDKRIQRCFQKRDDGKWTHKRLEKERTKQSEHRKKQSAAGKKGAEARWQPHGDRIAPPSESYSAASATAMPRNGSSVFSFQSSDCGSQTADGVAIDRGFPFDHFAVAEYERTLKPEPGLAIRQAELIADAVADSPESRAVWRDVLKIFTGNDYNPRHAGNALDRYQKEMAKIESGERSVPVVKLTDTERQARQSELRERMRGNGTR